MKLLEESEKTLWTKHVQAKMRQYRLSESRIGRVLRKPDRKDLGIAPRTIAVMQITGTKKHPTEIWVMYQKTKLKVKTTYPTTLPPEGRAPREKLKVIKIISAWRYPARSPIGEPPPIPEDILWEIKDELRNYKS